MAVSSASGSENSGDTDSNLGELFERIDELGESAPAADASISSESDVAGAHSAPGLHAHAADEQTEEANSSSNPSGALWVVPDLEEHMEKVRERPALVPAHAAPEAPVAAAPVANAALAAHALVGNDSDDQSHASTDTTDTTTVPAHAAPEEPVFVSEESVFGVDFAIPGEEEPAEDERVEESKTEEDVANEDGAEAKPTRTRQTGFLADVQPIHSESQEYATSQLGDDRPDELPDDVAFDRRDPNNQIDPDRQSNAARQATYRGAALPAAARRRTDEGYVNDRMPAAARVKRPTMRSKKNNKQQASAPVAPPVELAAEDTNVEPAFDRSDAQGLLSDPLAIQDIEVPTAKTGGDSDDDELKNHGVYFHDSIAGAPWAQGIKARPEDIEDEERSGSGLTKLLFVALLLAVLVVAAIRFGIV